jgi:DNA invertase Pin-like site-specific DNA recombinase
MTSRRLPPSWESQAVVETVRSMAAAGHTQSEVASRLGVSVSTVYIVSRHLALQWHRGRRPARGKKLPPLPG